MGENLDKMVVRGAYAVICLVVIAISLLIIFDEIEGNAFVDGGAFVAVILALIGVITIVVKRPSKGD